MLYKEKEMIEVLKQMVDALEELVPDPETGFAPAYEGIKQRQEKAIEAGKQAIAELIKKGVNHD
jgi:hypothetical protein